MLFAPFSLISFALNAAAYAQRCLHLHFGLYSLKKPFGKQVRMLGPTSRLPGPQRYSITEPMSTLRANMVELVGRSGLLSETNVA